MLSPAARTPLSERNTFETPAFAKSGSLERRRSLPSPSTATTPTEEARLLRQVSDVLREHLDTVTKAAARCALQAVAVKLALTFDAPHSSAREREEAEAAAAVDLHALHLQLSGGEEDAACTEGAVSARWATLGFSENSFLRRDVLTFWSELSDLVALPKRAAAWSNAAAWASATSSSIQSALAAAAPVLRAVVSDEALAEMQTERSSQMAAADVPRDPAFLVDGDESTKESVPVVEEAIATTVINQTAPATKPTRGGSFLRRAVLLLLCAGAAVAVQRRKELLVKPAPAKASSESA